MNPTLAHKFKSQPITGWWMSEKLDGVRAIWDGQQLKSRTGKVFSAPDWFIANLPTDQILDGELFEGRGLFQTTVGKIRAKQGDWSAIKFMVFDVVNESTLEQRQSFLNQLNLPEHCITVEQTKCTGKQHLNEYEQNILTLGGEGVMLRQPRSVYEFKRSHTLLKVKQFSSDEAVVIGHEEGMGQHQGRLGALVCEYKNKTFKIGTGFSNALREIPPAIGSLVTFSFFELTDGGIPRHPSFVAVRNYE